MLRRKPLKRGKPPVRRKPLRPKTPLSRGSGSRTRPTKRKAPAGRWDAWRRSQYELVGRRGVWCEVLGCGAYWQHRHHPFGRRAEPWASSLLILVLVCDRHHRQVTGEVGDGLDVALRAQLRLTALRRMELYVAEVEALLYGEVHMIVGVSDPTRKFDLLRKSAEYRRIGPPGWAG